MRNSNRFIMKLLLFFLPAFICFHFQVVKAQQIEAKVQLSLELLPLEKQQKLKYFSDRLEDYLNSYNWTDDSFDEPIPVTVQIFMEERSVSYESRYGARFLISNNLDVQFFDKYWRFPYDEGSPILHNDNVFDPLASFLDYYIYLLLGSEYDKMGKFLGTPLYIKAKRICEQAKFNTLYSYGWDDRLIKIDTILSDDNLPFRRMKDLMYLGFSYEGQADSTALRYCRQAIDLLDQILTADPKNDQALNFLQAHYIDCMDLFKNDETILRIFMRIDPAHAETYKNYINRKK